jgi:hypothetical protein
MEYLMSDEDLENFVMPTFSFRPLRPEEKRPEDGIRIFIRSDNPNIYVQALGRGRDRTNALLCSGMKDELYFGLPRRLRIIQTQRIGR